MKNKIKLKPQSKCLRKLSQEIRKAFKKFHSKLFVRMRNGPRLITNMNHPNDVNFIIQERLAIAKLNIL